MADHQPDCTTPGRNTLLDTAAAAGKGLAACIDVLTGTPSGDTTALVISYDRTPDDWLHAWLRHNTERPTAFKFIHVGETMRSAAAPTTATSSTAPPTAATQPIQTVRDPTDLTALGITISNALEELSADGQQTVMCFDSVTALLTATGDLPQTFRFLHTLVGRVQVADARACYLFDGAAHDRQTRATLADLFDAHYP